MVGIGVPPIGLVLLVLLGFTIATTVNTFAMEAAVLFVPAFLFVFPRVVPGFPEIGIKAAVGLALFVELFGYSSSVGAYWFRHQIDFYIAKRVLAITIPIAVVARVGSYLVPSNLLMLAFAGLLIVLSIILYEAHERGPSLMDTVLEKPVSGFGVVDAMPGEDSHVTLGDAVPEAVENLSLVDGMPGGYEPRTRVLADGGEPGAGTREGFHVEPLDAVITAVGGLLAGLVGIAVGELTQTMLTVRKKIPIQISTGTSAFVLHLTIVSALVTNLLLLRFAPAVAGEGFTIPFGVGAFVAVGCLFGGQMGAYLNNRLSEETVMAMLIVAYFAIGVFVAARTLLLGAGH
jgi:uncharacterized membrane protein YfcA